VVLVVQAAEVVAEELQLELMLLQEAQQLQVKEIMEDEDNHLTLLGAAEAEEQEVQGQMALLLETEDLVLQFLVLHTLAEVVVVELMVLAEVLAAEVVEETIADRLLEQVVAPLTQVVVEVGKQ
jgi:hypothetical protein